jgi:beta-lactamase superfamily II metal-dependent hydrolase
MRSIKLSRLFNQVFRIIIFCLLFIIFLPEIVSSTPPIYKTLKREQREIYTPKSDDLMRIWIVFVDQGDGILIQLPNKYNYSPQKNESPTEKSERLDILVDGGSFYATDEKRMMNFLHAVYPKPTIAIEYAIISHHDSDHIKGLIKILQDPSIAVRHIFHNGLASHRPTSEILDDIGKSNGAITNIKKKKIEEVMASLENDGQTLKSSYLIDNLSQLEKQFNQDEFTGLYKNLAQAIIGKREPNAVAEFSRVWEKSRFINEIQTSEHSRLPDIDLKLIWPQNKLSAYKNNKWGETINGNSVTFRFKYGDFEMLLPGDQNDLSELAMLKHLKEIGQADLLKCDVLKVPHHGSSHNSEELFKASQPVISVASMGKRGFALDWKHPSTDVVQWAGGAHLFYSTYIHERKFDWNDMKNAEKQKNMLEKKHILIETDGKWFRLVEIDSSVNDLSKIPTVEQTSRGNGTYWIKAY